MHLIAILLYLTGFGGFDSASGRDESRPAIQPLESPAGEKSHLPNLAAGADGKLYLSWVEPGVRSEVLLRFSVATEKGWSEPRTIARGSDWFVNWADFPSMAALPNGTLAAHWLGRLASGTYTYGVQVSLSRDGGKKWGAPITPHRDTSPTEHGFVSIVPLDEERFGLYWLDGRTMYDHGAGGGDHEHGTGNMALRTTTLDRSGKLGPDLRLDERTCECCSTDAKKVGDSVVIAYRDRSDDEVRDVSLIRVDGDGKFTARQVHEDGWKIEGCPVNGPALAARGEEVAAVWYTEKKERPQVLFARSTDGGKTFGTPVVVDDGNPVGRVDLTTHPEAGWLVVWLEQGDQRGEVRLRWIDPAGIPRPSLLVARTSMERTAGFPRIERVGERIVVAWTEVVDAPGTGAAPSGIRTARLVYPTEEDEDDADDGS